MTVPDNTSFDVYLVDDNSPDNTGNIVKDRYPQINVIQGTGNLFWNQGMRLAWDEAAKHFDYDFYLWLNDDTLLNVDALLVLFDDYKQFNHSVIISGTCSDNTLNNVSYGGRDAKGKHLKPTGRPQICRYMNGNFVMIPSEIYHTIGNLSNSFTHAVGDTDYGLRAMKKGFHCYISSRYIAICNRNAISKWRNPKESLTSRYKSLYSVKDFCLTERFVFWKRHFGFFHACCYFVMHNIIVVFPNMKRKI